MKNQVLSINQMQVLKGLGIDTSKAEIYWVKQVNGSRINTPLNGKPFISLNNSDQLMKFGFIRYENTPTFTLQDMLNIMPDAIMLNGDSYYLYLDKKLTGYINIEEGYCHEESDGDILSNTYNMLIWLAKNKLLINQ